MSKKKIIIVDDQLSLLTTLKFIFEEYGFDVSMASSGPEALRLMKGKAAHLTPAAISQIINDSREPSLKSLLQICASLNLTPNDLLSFHSDDKYKLNTRIAVLERKIMKAKQILDSE